jgi:DNA replication and repair protein RecF
VYLASLELRDFRRYEHVEVEFAPGVTLVEGRNGAGKTTLLEAIAWVALGRSFRGVPDAALVREGRDQAIVRAVVDDDGRRQTLDAELRALGRNRVVINGHPLARTRDRFDLLRVTVFAPDDLALVKGGPAARREYLDDLLVVLAPRYEAARGDFERVLKHRNALLKSGVRGEEAITTLEVFDEQLVRAGAELVRGRLKLVERLGPEIASAYARLAGRAAPVEARYAAEWAQDALTPDAVEGVLRSAVSAMHRKEVERGVTLVGPHRDEWRIMLDGLDTRTHASQGEQRCLALALRLAGHSVCHATLSAAPVVLLDDVFSELDDDRAHALARALPASQTVITSAVVSSGVIAPDLRLRVEDGRLLTSEG